MVLIASRILIESLIIFDYVFVVYFDSDTLGHPSMMQTQATILAL